MSGCGEEGREEPIRPRRGAGNERGAPSQGTAHGLAVQSQRALKTYIPVAWTKEAIFGNIYVYTTYMHGITIHEKSHVFDGEQRRLY